MNDNDDKLHRLYITKPTDRESVIVILARNGYTVRQGKERSEGKTYSFVEFWKGAYHIG